jgi:hypothetical protein
MYFAHIECDLCDCGIIKWVGHLQGPKIQDYWHSVASWKQTGVVNRHAGVYTWQKYITNIVRCIHRDTLVETACRLYSGSGMQIIYCCPIKLGGELFNYTGFLSPLSFSLPLSCSLPFSLPALGGCQFLTLEAPLIAGKAPCMYNGYIYI